MSSLREKLKLYLVLDPDSVAGDLLAIAAAAIRGGVSALQLRCKGWTDLDTFALAQQLRPLATDAGVLFLINDRIDLALASCADGVHLGVDDLPLEEARRIGGPDFVIGYSPETDEQNEASAARGASYLGVGPVYATATKRDAGSAIGLEAITRRAQLTSVPIVGIGGITAETAPSVIASGACGVAVVSAIAGASDPEAAARKLRGAMRQ